MVIHFQLCCADPRKKQNLNLLLIAVALNLPSRNMRVTLYPYVTSSPARSVADWRRSSSVARLTTETDDKAAAAADEAATITG